MQAELAFKALGYGLIGLLLITMLALVFASMRKEERWGEPLGGLFWLNTSVDPYGLNIWLCGHRVSVGSS